MKRRALGKFGDGPKSIQLFRVFEVMFLDSVHLPNITRYTCFSFFSPAVKNDSISPFTPAPCPEFYPVFFSGKVDSM